MDESKSINKLKLKMIKELPFFPNDRETIEHLKSQNLNSVLIHYLHWKTRIVPPRPRKTIISSEVTSDGRWTSLKHGINGLLEKVKSGNDIYPYHSDKAHRKGYTPFHYSDSGEVDTWLDKDQLLNTTGFHHFHLNMNVQHTGLSERTDDVLFASVTRDTFHAIGIFNHDVFESVNCNDSVSEERKRMWKIHKYYTEQGMEPKETYIANPIMSSGHPLFLIPMCDNYARIIREHDCKLNDRFFANSLYDQAKWQYPNKFKFEWHLDGLDLALLDKRNMKQFNIHLGYM
jgi:hypothetical protein